MAKIKLNSAKNYPSGDWTRDLLVITLALYWPYIIDFDDFQNQ